MVTVCDVGTSSLVHERVTISPVFAYEGLGLFEVMVMGSRVGGHFVTGHVDAAAPVISFQLWEQPFWRLRVALPQNLKGLVATKGSIAIDGVSLTVTQLGSSWFEVMLVPHTLAQTTMGQLKAGTFVNLEADPLARYAHAAALSLLRNKR
jgi:riboflavin synthase alpha subunit